MPTAVPRGPARRDKPRRDATIHVRASLQTRDLIERAAEVAGKTMTEFVLESATQHAMDVLVDQRLFSLGEEAFAAFERALDEPPRPNAQLKSLLASRSPWEA